jgi:hypothetical protein
MSNIYLCTAVLYFCVLVGKHRKEKYILCLSLVLVKAGQIFESQNNMIEIETIVNNI